MSLITEELYSRMVTIPISLPQTILGPNSSLVVASVKLELGDVLRFRWMNMHLIQTSAALGTKVNSALGWGYAGIYAGVRHHLPTGIPLALIVSSTAGVRSTNPFAKRDFSSPDTYEVIVTNNVTDATVKVALSGCLQLFVKK